MSGGEDMAIKRKRKIPQKYKSLRDSRFKDIIKNKNREKKEKKYK